MWYSYRYQIKRYGKRDGRRSPPGGGRSRFFYLRFSVACSVVCSDFIQNSLNSAPPNHPLAARLPPSMAREESLGLFVLSFFDGYRRFVALRLRHDLGLNLELDFFFLQNGDKRFRLGHGFKCPKNFQHDPLHKNNTPISSEAGTRITELPEILSLPADF